MFERLCKNLTIWDLWAIAFCIAALIGACGDMPNDMLRTMFLCMLLYMCLGGHARSREKLDSLHNKVDELTKQVKKQKDEIGELTEELKKR